MTVKNVKEAWAKADIIFPTDYMKDEAKSARAGYDIYYSTAAGVHAWISDLGSRLEVNLADGSTVNIFIEEEPQFSVGQLSDALEVINTTIYMIDDLILPKLQEVTGISEARSKLYGAFAVIGEILKSQHPDSPLYKRYNLQDA